MSGHNWSLRWSYYRTSQCCLLDVSDSRTMEPLSLRRDMLLYCGLNSVCSIFAYSECNKRGQTSRSVVRAEIQTSCNFKANICDCSYLLDYIRCCFDIHLLSRLIPIWIGSILIPLCLSTSIFSYTKIFVNLRRHQTQVQDHAQQEQPNQPAPLNIESYRKVVSSVLWVQCTLVACCLPFPNECELY